MVYAKLATYLTEWIREQVEAAQAQGCVVGISGGVDSAVVAALCRRAFPDAVLGIHMPCYSNPQDTADARLVAESLGIKYQERDLGRIFDTVLETLGSGKEGTEERAALAAANVKARLRMITLYYCAQLNNYLVIGTGNRSELEVGYFTKYGDGGVDLLPLGGLVKTQVWELARYLQIPEAVINKLPSAGLWEGQTDEGELTFTYRELDQLLLTGQGDERVKAEVQRRKAMSRHKLQMPSIPSIDLTQLTGGKE